MEIFMIKLLEEKYQKKVIIYNDMYLFFNGVAKDFIRTCKNYNIHIDSLDAFSITGRGIQPAISNSISFPKTSNCWEEAILFLCRILISIILRMMEKENGKNTGDSSRTWN